MEHHVNRTFKILVESSTLSASDLKDIQEWENEGGAPPSTYDLLKSAAPLRRGDMFEVTGGDLHPEDGKLYYEAEVKLLSRA